MSKIKINLLLIVCFLSFGKFSAVTLTNELKEDFFLTHVIVPEKETCIKNSNSAEFPKFHVDFVFIQDSTLAAKEKLILKLKRRKKIISSILAFPFPFGIIGLHRIYLGSKPYVPLAYIASLGGELGIIPFIDFVILLSTKDVTKFQDNPNLIMWAD